MHSNNRIFQTLFIIILFLPISLVAQEKAGKLTIKTGQSADNDVTRSQPAKAIATFPRDTTRSSYSINGFLEFGIYIPDNNEPRRTFSIILEQQKNTLISKKQDVFQIGGQWKEILFFKRTKRYKPKITLSGKYSDDMVNDKEGFQILSHFSLYPSDLKARFCDAFLQNDFVYPGNERELDTSGEFLWSDVIQIASAHTLGFEHIGYNDENLSLVHFAYNLELYPFSGLLYQVLNQYQLIKIDLGIDLRTRISSNETTLFEGNSIKGAIGLNVFLDKEKKQSIGFAYSYQEGGDPLKGLADQAFSQLAITALFSIDSLK